MFIDIFRRLILFVIFTSLIDNGCFNRINKRCKMKIFFIFLIVITSPIILCAQPPSKINYQKVVRNSNNELLVNTTIGLKVSILKKEENNITVYSETHQTATNANGLTTIIIGTGNREAEDMIFDEIDWSSGLYFIKTDIDPAGGTNYSLSDSIQILSSPYALHSKTTESLTGQIGRAHV